MYDTSLGCGRALRVTDLDGPRLPGTRSELLTQLTAFIRAGKYLVGLRDREAASAHNYFPDSVLAGVAELLPVLEAHLDGIPAKQDKLAKADLLSLCVDSSGPVDSRDSSREEILRELAFAAMVERGIADSDAGRTISNEEMARRIESWRR